MKYFMTLLVMIFSCTLVMAAPGGKHHKITAYDYHEYLNSDIQTKTFDRYESGVLVDLVWDFYRPEPGKVVITEVATDGGGQVTRYIENTLLSTTDAFNWVQSKRYDGNVDPPQLIETMDFDPPVVVLNSAMVPGIAWGSASTVTSDPPAVENFITKSEVLAIEEVTVPAGTFQNCLKIHRTRQFAFSFHSRMDWYCPDMGLVKRMHGGNILIELSGVTY